MNRWKIPGWLEQEVLERDSCCVYCGVRFELSGSGSRRNRPSWEHIINDVTVINRENIAVCCVGCNASKGSKDLAIWLNSQYCKANGITAKSVAPVIQRVLLASSLSDECRT